MGLPPLYKYLNVSGAKLTLRNKTFKHAKPSDFNDTEDLTISSIFREDVEIAFENISKNFTNVILKYLHVEPTCGSPMREKIQLIQQVYKLNPGSADLVQNELMNSISELYNNGYYQELTEFHVSEINGFMQSYRVLCVTTHNNSEYMWNEYAEGHKGIIVRIEPNVAKDSKFQLFRPVCYRNRRPPLYEDSLDFIAGSLFGDQEARIREAVNRIIYTKTLDWQGEDEYRLAIPIVGNEKAWDTLPYHSEEITELYLGCEMEEKDVEYITNKALNVNPKLSIFQIKRNGGGGLVIEPYKPDDK